MVHSRSGAREISLSRSRGSFMWAMGRHHLQRLRGEAGSGVQALTSEVLGLAVVTQTCDIVRSCGNRPYFEVAPLVRVSEEELYNVRRGRRPAHATLPLLEKDRLVVDLDRVTTVEKSIVASWKRTPGFSRDADARAALWALCEAHRGMPHAPPVGRAAHI